MHTTATLTCRLLYRCDHWKRCDWNWRSDNGVIRLIGAASGFEVLGATGRPSPKHRRSDRMRENIVMLNDMFVGVRWARGVRRLARAASQGWTRRVVSLGNGLPIPVSLSANIIRVRVVMERWTNFW